MLRAIYSLWNLIRAGHLCCLMTLFIQLNKLVQYNICVCGCWSVNESVSAPVSLLFCTTAESFISKCIYLIYQESFLCVCVCLIFSCFSFLSTSATYYLDLARLDIFQGQSCEAMAQILVLLKPLPHFFCQHFHKPLDSHL